MIRRGPPLGLALLFGILASASVIAGIGRIILQEDRRAAERAIEFNESVRIRFSKSAKRVRIWMPVPMNDDYQRAELISIDSPYPYRITQDGDFGNRLIYIESDSLEPPVSGDIEIRALYKIVRKEQRPPKPPAKTAASSIPIWYLQPRGLEAVNEKIKSISLEAARGADDPMQKAHALYEYVLKHMRYDKSGEGWGRGDSLYACEIGKGNCTDFHSLFIALTRAGGIPARFQMGIPLPESFEGEPGAPYHCWAEFYIDGKGWIPVDISEAWKNPGKAEYFFGNLDANRILLSTGREITLSPRQEGPPLNYLSRPYVEINGLPVNDFKLERRFKNKRV